ncbi:hypothetical protein VRB67_07430 [Pseudomonas trivialis]|uniref:hypothetical protein n=1 Tax=Pseudomonas trivialis TaxID=200450 RepID=UPI0030CCEB30
MKKLTGLFSWQFGIVALQNDAPRLFSRPVRAPGVFTGPSVLIAVAKISLQVYPGVASASAPCIAYWSQVPVMSALHDLALFGAHPT